MSRRYRAGETLDDHCRACKLARRHTVMVASPDGAPVRVICDYCGSQHNYRGGPREARPRQAGPVPRSSDPVPLVSDRERSVPPMSHNDGSSTDLELLLRRIIREEAGVTPVVPADKWRGGDLVLRPGREGLQEKSWPIETFFNKVVMVRNRLRLIEQQINATSLAEEVKVKLQAYITACYGSLTSFNVLFADEDDRFHGTGKR